MKRTKIYIFLMLLGMVFLFDGCKKDKDDDGPVGKSCEELADDYYNAVVAFTTNPTEATCNAFEDAVEAYLSGCAILTPAQKQELQQALDENDCSVYGNKK
jgi:hypothetical protein